MCYDTREHLCGHTILSEKTKGKYHGKNIFCLTEPKFSTDHSWQDLLCLETYDTIDCRRQRMVNIHVQGKKYRTQQCVKWNFNKAQSSIPAHQNMDAVHSAAALFAQLPNVLLVFTTSKCANDNPSSPRKVFKPSGGKETSSQTKRWNSVRQIQIQQSDFEQGIKTMLSLERTSSAR